MTHLKGGSGDRGSIGLWSQFLCVGVIFLGSGGLWAGEELPVAREAPISREASEQQIRFFETKIRPLLADHCNDCHGPDEQESELRLDTLEGMLIGGNAGSSLIPGNPRGSLIVTAVTYRDNDLQMPPDEKLSDQQIADLSRWVEMGAPHPNRGNLKEIRPRDEVDLEQGRQHWAFQKPIQPTPPRQDDDSLTHPIDAFILDDLHQHGLHPAGQASKEILIRRATFDLIGLPPTIEQIDRFLSDHSPDAFGRVVDRLLESPHYGERWGRHWLDIARYADSNGSDENVAHGNAWRYRDYVVQSFNEDKPYDEFLTEQLAGDLLDSGDDTQRKHQRLIATGFLVLGPKVLAEVDETKMEMDIVDEQLDTIGRGIMGLTLGCARCHSHKFDPISQRDYYALAGILKSTRTMKTFKKVAKWHENYLASAEEIVRAEDHRKKLDQVKKKLAGRLKKAKEELKKNAAEAITAQTAPAATSQEKIENRFPVETRTEIKELRSQLLQLDQSDPSVPSAMGVTEGTIANTFVHIRGSHLTLGEEVPRSFLRVLVSDDPPKLPPQRSGRLELARWLTDGNHPLTARVMINRIWRGHFGKGLVTTTDNFGIQGQPPMHPELLDFLAVEFVESGWSIKTMHRLIMSSQCYQRRCDFDAHNAKIDPSNRYDWRRDIRRLEAEAIRDAMLALSGKLDRTIGGSLLKIKNREYVFDHTSKEQQPIETSRRSIYLPVIRNHLDDLFQLFDYTSASVLNGDRSTSTISPQALYLMNSPTVDGLARSLAERLIGWSESSDIRVDRLFRMAYGRGARPEETERILTFLMEFSDSLVRDADQPISDPPDQQAWQAICQSIFGSSEFLYVR